MGSLREQFREQEASRAQKQSPTILTVTNMAIAAGVVAVVLVLALVVPKMVPNSGEERYLDDRDIISKRVAVYSSGYSPKPVTTIERSGGQLTNTALGILPIFALTHLGSDSALKEEDIGNEEITGLGVEASNPKGSKEYSRTPSWEDVDGDSMRDPVDDKLFYHNALPAPAVDHWNTVTVTVDGTDYVVDSRDYFINFDRMLKRGFIDVMPESASPDNSVDGTGSYSWYVDENLMVKSMLYAEPVAEMDGYQGVYP